ncbi:unnamed protein product, partial [Prorocentrum cordatum]
RGLGSEDIVATLAGVPRESLAADHWEDSVEHYSRCRVVRRAHATMLNLTGEWFLPWWLGVHKDQSNDQLLALGTIGAYAACRVTNTARHQGGFTASDGERALQQSIREAVGGHVKSESFLAEENVAESIPTQAPAPPQAAPAASAAPELESKAQTKPSVDRAAESYNSEGKTAKAAAAEAGEAAGDPTPCPERTCTTYSWHLE